MPTTVGHDGKFERTRHSRVNEYPGWNTLEVIVRGDRATHIVNGVTNMRVYDIKGWDAATNAWVKVDHGKIALQAESAEIFYRNIRIRPLTDADDMPPEPRPRRCGSRCRAKVTPGATPGAPPSDAIVLFDGKNLDAWKSAKGDAPARWNVVNGELIVAPGTGDIQTREKFGDVQLHVEWWDPNLPADKVNQDRGNSGIFLQDVYEVQVLDNFENKTYVNGMVGSHLQAISAAGECRVAGRTLADLRHHLHGAALCGGRLAQLAGACHRAAQRRAGAERRRAQGRHHLHRRAELPAAWRHAAAAAGSLAPGSLPQYLAAQALTDTFSLRSRDWPVRAAAPCACR